MKALLQGTSGLQKLTTGLAMPDTSVSNSLRLLYESFRRQEVGLAVRPSLFEILQQEDMNNTPKPNWLAWLQRLSLENETLTRLKAALLQLRRRPF